MHPCTGRNAVLPAAFLLLCGAAWAGDADGEADALRAALAKESAFEFNETPFEEALADIARKAGVEIVLSPADYADRGRVPITWHSEKSSAARALRWVTRLADLEFGITDGAVFVADPGDFVGSVVPRVYDVRDLARDDGGRYGPLVGFSPDDMTDSPERVDSTGSIAEMISSRVCPSKWDAALGTSIEERDGALVVFQTSEVHVQIETLLAGLRAVRPRAVRVEVVVLAADAAKPVAARAEEGTLTPEELERLTSRAGRDAVIARATLATLDGRAAHTVWGAKTHFIATKNLQWPQVEDERYHDDLLQYEVIPVGGDEDPKVVVVKTPPPPPPVPPPGDGVVVPVVDALLDGVLIEVAPRLDDDRLRAELDLRVVISHPREIPEAHAPEPDAIQTPTVAYSRLATTARVSVGDFALVGKTAVRRGEDDVAALVLARVTVDER